MGKQGIVYKLLHLLNYNTVAKTAISLMSIHMRSPRVYIDGYPLENRAQRGIARVVTEAISRTYNVIDYTIGHENPIIYPIYGAAFRTCRRGQDQKDLRTRLGLRKMPLPKPSILEGEFDVFHSAYFITCPVQQIHKIQHVHDMIPELLPRMMGRWGQRESTRKASAIRQADTLICVSHATKSALLEVHPQLKSRIEVVPHGGDHLCRDQKPIFEVAARPYVLFVGHRTTYKNFEVVLKAVTSKRWPSWLRLLVVGDLPSNQECEYVAKHRVRDRIEWLSNVMDEQLAELYNQAGAFVFPSKMEGFGLPILEAQLNGCPLVASDIPVFREVAGNAAVFFSPDSPDELLDAIQTALDERLALIERGFVNAARYSWEAAATQLVNIYRSCLQ